MMGDFIAMFDGSHKSNGRHVSTYKMKDFLQCTADAHLISPHLIGHWFMA